jgi:hypothetical protein
LEHTAFRGLLSAPMNTERKKERKKELKKERKKELKREREKLSALKLVFHSSDCINSD